MALSDSPWRARPAAGSTGPSVDPYPDMPKQVKVRNTAELKANDPTLYEAFDTVKSALALGLIPSPSALELVEAMPIGLQKELVTRLSSMDAAVMLSFKNQIKMVEKILSDVIDSQGESTKYGKDTGISPKEAVNLHLRLTTSLSREMPKFAKMEKAQRLETALFDVVEKFLTKEQQTAVLNALDKLNVEEARRGR